MPCDSVRVLVLGIGCDVDPRQEGRIDVRVRCL